MDAKDQNQFKEAFFQAASIFMIEANEQMVRGHWNALKKYDIQTVCQAYEQSISTLEWFPKPKQLIDICESIKPAMTYMERLESMKNADGASKLLVTGSRLIEIQEQQAAMQSDVKKLENNNGI